MPESRQVKFLADECVDRQIVDRLRREEHEVRYVVEMEPGISDDEVLNLANLEKSILLTADKDFGELIFRQGKSENFTTTLMPRKHFFRVRTRSRKQGKCKKTKRSIEYW
jgi:hypothetical protein